jgi:hypothetical protein
MVAFSDKGERLVGMPAKRQARGALPAPPGRADAPRAGPRGVGKSLVLRRALEHMAALHGDTLVPVRLSGLLHADERAALREVARQLGALIDFVMRDFVMSWYHVGETGGGISNDGRFLEYVQHILTNMVGNLAFRAAHTNPLLLLVEDLRQCMQWQTHCQ